MSAKADILLQKTLKILNFKSAEEKQLCEDIKNYFKEGDLINTLREERKILLQQPQVTGADKQKIHQLEERIAFHETGRFLSLKDETAMDIIHRAAELLQK